MKKYCGGKGGSGKPGRKLGGRSNFELEYMGEGRGYFIKLLSLDEIIKIIFLFQDKYIPSI